MTTEAERLYAAMVLRTDRSGRLRSTLVDCAADAGVTGPAAVTLVRTKLADRVERTETGYYLPQVAAEHR